jgi:uncharacterized RDD family membrane protein YckC
MSEQNQAETPAGAAGPQYQPSAVYAQPRSGGPGQTPDLGKRFLAQLIDGVILAVISMIPVIGGLAAAAGWLLRDIAIDGQSPGKKIMGERVVRLDGQPLTANESIRRNWMFAIGSLGSTFLIIPILGWAVAIILFLAAFGLGLFEAINVLSNKPRLGDNMAGTRVIVEQPQPAVGY